MSTTTEAPVKWWQGTNFYIGAMMLILAPFGISQGFATEVVTFGFSAVSLVGLTRSTVITAKFKGWAALFSDKNWWNYASATVIAFSPAIATLIPPLQEIAGAISLKNYGGIITGLLTLGTMIFHLIKK